MGGVSLHRGQYFLFGEVSHTTVASDPQRFVGFERVLRRIDEIVRNEANRYIEQGITSNLEGLMTSRLNNLLQVEAGRGLLHSAIIRPNNPETRDAHTLYFQLAVNGIDTLRNINIQQTSTLGA